MEVDAALYASISREMLESGNYHLIRLKGEDWLDKPHLQYWITLLSFKILGVSTVAYKLPSLVLFLTGVCYTYMFAKRVYPTPVAWLSVLLLTTAWHIVISNNDVWAEPILTGFTIMSLYHFTLYLESKKLLHFAAGCFGAACLLMTKGLVTIMPVASAILLSLMNRARWKEIFHWQWLAALLLITIFISPSLVAYYYQFDAHPEKEFFGRTGLSGIKFFLWDSQWGRFTNTGPITRMTGSGFFEGIGDISFYFHSMIWVFAPWAFLAFFALFNKAKSLGNKGIAQYESYTFFGFVFMFILFSFSRFQLPHFLNPILPFVSIITAQYIYQILRRGRNVKFFFNLQTGSVILLILFLIGFQVLFRAKISPDTIVTGILVLAFITLIYFRSRSRFQRIVFPPALAIIFVNYFLNRDFYTVLLRYQSESEVAFYMNRQSIDESSLACFRKPQYATDFYLKTIVPDLTVNRILSGEWNNKILYTSADGLKELEDLKVKFDMLQIFNDFGVQNLSYKFVNHNTRELSLSQTYLIKLRQEPSISSCRPKALDLATPVKANTQKIREVHPQKCRLHNNLILYMKKSS